jgi:hypothetical protein
LTQNTYAPEEQEVELDTMASSGDNPLVGSLVRGVNSSRKLLFRLKWVVMSPEKRYAHLWAVTMRSPGYLSRN